MTRVDPALRRLVYLATQLDQLDVIRARRDDELLRLARAGQHTDSELAEAAHVSRVQVQRVKRAAGITARRVASSDPWAGELDE